MPRQTVVQICGVDRATFLHNFCTNDIKTLAEYNSCELFITTVQGRCLGYGTVTALKDSLVLATSPNQSATIIEHLSKYVITEDVHFVDLSERNAFLLTSADDAPVEIGEHDNGNIVLDCHWFESNAVWILVPPMINPQKSLGVNRFPLTKHMRCELKTESLFMDSTYASTIFLTKSSELAKLLTSTKDVISVKNPSLGSIQWVM